jgi:hypothetical protein
MQGYNGDMASDSKSAPEWVDPVKNLPAKESTLNTPLSSFGEFTDFMRKIVNKQEEKPKPSSSRAPDAS